MRSTFLGFALSAVACIAIYSCTHVSGTYVSTHGAMAGRSMKDNCMTCHTIGATQGGFSVGGTIYKQDAVTRYPNGTVYLHTLANGQDSLRDDGTIFMKDSIIATIEVDGVGNFYTTHPIDMTSGVYPEIVSSTGQQAFMQAPINNGACNSCHGVSQARIYAY